MYAAVRAFKTKLCLWNTKMLQGNLRHFPGCQTMKKQVSPTVEPSAQLPRFTEKVIVFIEGNYY